MEVPLRSRRLVAAFLLCALIALAGCTALPFVEGNAADAEPYTESGEPVDGDALLRDHLDALGNAGALTVNGTRTVTYGEFGSDQFRNVTALNLESGEAVRHRAEPVVADDGLGTRHLYYNGTTGFVNETRGRGEDRYTHYFTVDDPAAASGFGPLDLSVYDGLDGRVDALNWTQRGVERHDPSGASVTRYEATLEDASNRAAFASAYDVGSVSELEAFNAALLVQENGVVRELRYEYERTSQTVDGETVTITERRVVRIEHLGDTEIEEPEWTSRT